MSCPTLSSIGTGLVCLYLNKADTSKCCKHFEAYESCGDFFYEYVGDTLQGCLNETLMGATPGLCYLTVGTVSSGVCGANLLVPESARFPEGVLHPSAQWLYLMFMGLAVLLFVGSFIGHVCQQRNLKYQATYLLLLFVFMIACVVIVPTIYVPKSGPAIEVLIALFEGYLAYTFGGLMVSWSNEHGNVFDALMDCPSASRPYAFLKCYWGPQFRDGEAALKFWKLSIIQFAFLKALTQIGTMSSYYVRNQLSLIKGYALLFSTINLFAILIMLRALGKLYKAFNAKKLLVGLKALRKFMVVKLIFTALVINNLVIANLLNAGIIVPDDSLCLDADGTMVSQEECSQRFLAVVFMGEVTVLLLFGVLVFSPNDFDKPDNCCNRDETFSPGKLLWQMLKMIDTRALWRVGPSTTTNATTSSPFMEDLESGEEAILRKKSSHHSQRQYKYKRLGWLFGITACVTLTVGIFTPLWFTSEVNGCKMSMSYVTSVWCHGSCVTEATTVMDAIKTADGTRDMLIYGVCNANFTSAGLWATLGTFFALFAVSIAVAALVLRGPFSLGLAGILGLISFFLFVFNAPSNFKSNNTVKSLFLFGATEPSFAFASIFFLIGCIAALITGFAIFRFRHHAKKLYLVQAEVEEATRKSSVKNVESLDPAASSTTNT